MENNIIAGFTLTALSYLLGSVVFYRFSVARGFKPSESRNILLSALLGGVAGAKLTSLGIALLSGASAGDILAHPDGRTIIGGVVFGWITVEIAKPRLGIKRSTGDGFALALALGEAIGRLGCFFNGCCYGIASSVPWAVYQAAALRHPTQLYSSAAALLLFFLLLYLKNKVRFEGDLFRIYLLLFGLSRFSIEYFREHGPEFYGLSLMQWTSLEISASMVITLAWIYSRKGLLTERQNKNEAM